MADTDGYIILAQQAEHLRPYVKPGDISDYSPIYPSNPHPKIAKIASLMEELYSLFATMRYISASSIHFAPHTSKPISLKHCALFGLTKDVVDLMQMLPYCTGPYPGWNFGSDDGEFLFGGEFDMDMRAEEKADNWWKKCVDPLVLLDVDREKAQGWVEWGERDDQDHEPEGPENHRLRLYLRPWHVTLNKLGNHGTVLTLNTRAFTIEEHDQEWGSSDHDAIPYLEALLHKFRTLEYIPGGLYDDTDEHYNAYKSLYLDAGWPSNFDATKFEAAESQYAEDQDKRLDIEEPLRALRTHVYRMQDTAAAKLYHQHAIAKLDAMPKDADPAQRQKLEHLRDGKGEDFLHRGFAARREGTSLLLEAKKRQLQELRQHGDEEENIQRIEKVIEEAEILIKAKSLEEWQWLEYTWLRAKALEVDEKVRRRFEDSEGEVKGLEVELTRGVVDEMAKESFEYYKKYW